MLASAFAISNTSPSPKLLFLLIVFDASLMAGGADSASSSSKDKKKKCVSSSITTDEHPRTRFKRQKRSSSSSSMTTPTSTTAGGRWGELPNDILGLILQKLILQDQLRFSCVCVPWRLAVGPIPSPKPQLPWLMIAEAGQVRTSAKFISLSEHRTYDIPLPHPPIQERMFVGSSHGWLITLYDLSEMHLLNPITGVQVPLPAITATITAAAAATYPSAYIRTMSPRSIEAFFGKAILSSAPSRDGTGDLAVFLIRQMPMSSYRTLAIARIGDNAWTTFADECIVDIICRKDQLHIMGIQGYIHIWEQQKHDDHLSFIPKFTIDTKKFHHNTMPLERFYKDIRFSDMMNLVQPMTGELFMLIRIGITRKETRFLIVRLDLDRNEYVPVDDLKDLAFFVGFRDTTVVSAAKFPEVRRNCVYFTKYYRVKTADHDKFGVPYSLKKTLPTWARKLYVSTWSRNIGVFDVEKKKGTELLDGIGPHLSRKQKKHIGSILNCPPTTWITPTLF